MENTFNTRSPYSLAGWTLLGLLLVFLALEGWRYAGKPTGIINRHKIQQELATAADKFADKQHELLNRSEELADLLKPMLAKGLPPNELYQQLSAGSDIWGIALYQKKQPIVWKGFARLFSDEDPFSSTLEPEIVIRKNNNVIYWESRVPFSLKEEEGENTWYRLYTSYRLKQNNPLSIGSGSEFNFFQSDEVSSKYPLNFNLFSELPSDAEFTRQLNNLDGDSLGVVYATSDKFEQTGAEWDKKTRLWRSVYVAFAFIVLLVLLFVIAKKLKWQTALLMQLLFVGAGWLAFTYTNMLARWVLTLTAFVSSDHETVIRQLGTVSTHAIFALLTAFAFARELPFFNRKISVTSYLSTITIATFTGLINALVIQSVLNWLTQNAVLEQIPMMDLRILPAGRTVLLYTTLGFALLALAVALITLNRLLLHATRSHIRLTSTILWIAFLIGLFVSKLLMPGRPMPVWLLVTSLCCFAIIYGFAFGYAREIHWAYHLSPLRMVILGSIFIAGVSMPMLYHAYFTNLDNNLIINARSFAQEKNTEAEELTRQLLTQLEKSFQSITYNDLRNQQSAIQAEFTQTIQSFLTPKWSTYSFDLQMVSATENLIAGYSTNLNSPDWVNTYNLSMLEMVTEIQQITKSTIRPVVQQPQLKNQDDYETFYRGWIPVFGTARQSPIAWITGSVYKERPQFNKPIRAVMTSRTYKNWNDPMLMQRYNDGKLTNSVQQGFTGYFPKYQQLSSNQRRALATDSLIYYTHQADEHTYRSLLWQNGDSQTIKVSTVLANYRTILFAFFRFSFTLLVLGLCLLLIIQAISWGGFSIMGRDKRFQDRILDSFLLTTLVFLGFIIATSHYAIKQQNQNIVRQELVDKLESLSKSIEMNNIRRNRLIFNSRSSLESLTATLNADATFYTDLKVSETTTPQIYRQHLLPAALPYDTYQKLYLQQQRDAYSTVTLANQPLLIGYRSILDSNNQPLATIAIPTFLESPKYDQQLLETTSYLILAYLLVFGFFVLGSVFISKSLTRPLTYIRHGLNKISGGDLNTTIPVTSKDEIGNLAKAYNEMVFRLKNLQKELAEAEREAAWKEMAQQVAHEIKNPLTPMKLNVQHLERQLKTNRFEGEELKKHIQKITANLIEQIQSLSNIASDFSKFSQPIDKDFTTVDLQKILSSVKHLYQHDEQVDIRLDAPSERLQVQGITDDLKRVFINIVKNAYEAMEKDGTIRLLLYKEQQHAFIEIEDNGQGIAEENRSSIFVPNFSTKSGGTGLGLAICKKIVEAHGGSISFASVEGKGTTFVVKLPLG